MAVPNPQTVLDALLTKQIALNGGDSLPSQPVLNFTGSGVNVVDNPTANRTDITISSGGSSGGESVIQVAVGTSTAISTTTIPAGAIVTYAAITISVAYSGGTTISIGQSSNAGLLMATSDIFPGVASTQDAYQTTAWGGTSAGVLVTVAGSPSVGSATVTVKYAVPNT